jgi:biopolymer transport protein ExbD
VRCPNCRTKFSVAVPASAPSPEFHVEAESGLNAPLSRPSQKIDPEELIDMTAMVDIVFFLLIFFLVTSMSGIQSSAKLPRPEAHDDEHGAKKQQVDDPQNDPNAIVVKINKDDGIEIDGVPYREISDLVIRLRQLKSAGSSDASMLVVGHGEASHGIAVLVLDAGYEVGIDRLRLAVLADEAE